MLISQKQWEDIFKAAYRGDAQFGVPMKNYTSLAIGGPADVQVTPEDPVSLKNIVLLAGRNNIPFLAMGGGTNILVSDSGIDGIVINLRSFRMIQVIREEGNEVDLFVEAGVPLQMLVNFSKEKGYSGIEGLIGIPGTFGGALCGNAGSYGCEIKDVVQSAVVMSSEGNLERFDAGALGFGYRRSAIKPTDIVLNATVRLRKDDKEVVAGRTQRYLAEKIKNQPISERSAGCVFKNPEGSSAGKLIEEAGCKGMKLGNIEVSRVHANFFINRGSGTAADYLSLMHEVSLLVQKKSGVSLEPEIRVIGRG